jgi:hypothetical protein
MAAIVNNGTTKQKPRLDLNGYSYIMDRSTNEKTYWRCINYYLFLRWFLNVLNIPVLNNHCAERSVLKIPVLNVHQPLQSLWYIIVGELFSSMTCVYRVIIVL